MTDIVERLRCPPHAHAGTHGTKLDPYVVPQIMREAADEIERLRAEIEWRRSAAKAWQLIAQTNQELCDEIERLRAAIEKSPPAATGSR
jgi:hypothetical protein